MNSTFDGTKRALEMAKDLVAVAGETADLANTAVEQRNLFAAAFVHACDDEGTYFGLEALYLMAKTIVTPEAANFVRKVVGYERGA